LSLVPPRRDERESGVRIRKTRRRPTRIRRREGSDFYLLIPLMLDEQESEVRNQNMENRTAADED
jgi:hypothetical protein